jgi:hypothetical protein
MKDYTKDIGFWKRLQSFVSDVQTNCCMGEEEKQMIIHNCKLKILDMQRVSNSTLEEKKPKCDYYKDGGGCRYSGVCQIYDRSKIKCSCGL